MNVKVSDGGRVVIPAELRERHGIGIGDVLVWREEGDALVLSSRKAALRRAQAMFAPLKNDKDIVDELIRERRDAAARE